MDKICDLPSGKGFVCLGLLRICKARSELGYIHVKSRTLSLEICLQYRNEWRLTATRKIK